MKLRTLSLLFFLGIIHLSQAQTKSVLKAREYYAAGKYVEAQKMCEKGLENDKSTTELWFIKAISEYEMYLLPKYRKGDVD